MYTIAFHNLGCKVNSYELDLMQQAVQRKGFGIVRFDERADVYVINTCSVTNIADRKSRQMIHRAKTLNNDALVVAAGCYVQAEAFALAQDESVDLLIGNNKKAVIADLIEQFLEMKNAGRLSQFCAVLEGAHPEEILKKDESLIVPGTEDYNLSGTEKEIRNYLIKTMGNTTIPDLKKMPFEEGNLSRCENHTRAYIKIQDGCNRYCSYCIIPYTRGNVRSKDPDEVITEAQMLVSSGVREIVLTGIHISSYGIDFPKSETNPVTETLEERSAGYLLKLLERLNAIPGLKRIRLSSFEPRLINESFVKGLSKLPKICPHFHLSLQSGCNETLKRMNRRYTAEEYEEKVSLLRSVYPDAAITTDVIVGFPEETEKEFRTTKEFAEKIGFYEMHVFKYSRRKGTPADLNPEQIPEQVKNTRSDILLELTAKQSVEFRKKWLGREVEVLFEEPKEIDGKVYWTGHTKEYVMVALFSPEPLDNRLLRVIPTDFLTDEILLSKTGESAL